MARKIVGVIFTGLGQGASFMSLDWVRKVLQEGLGFAPYPATLNLRPESQSGIDLWNEIRQEVKGMDISPGESGFCHARFFRVEIRGSAGSETEKVKGGVILPGVEDYPADKIEVVAPVKIKDKFHVRDGDRLSLEFVD